VLAGISLDDRLNPINAELLGDSVSANPFFLSYKYDWDIREQRMTEESKEERRVYMGRRCKLR